jgi:uncharacterized membrane protein YcfT
MSTTNTKDAVLAARRLAVVASLAAGAIYLLIALGVVSVGASTREAATDLFGFGLIMAGVSVAVALGLWLFATSLVVLAGAAIVELIALVGYVAAWSLREPPFELWGMSIKVFQAIALVAIGYLLVRGRRTAQVAAGTRGGAA